MVDMITTLRGLRRLALASTQAELDAARMEAADILDQAGWERSARGVIETLGRSVSGPDDHSKSD
jgi:hypothetical protein